MERVRVGFALCGSFCTFEKTMAALEKTAKQFSDLVPIMSETSATTDTRFGKAADFMGRMEEICGKKVLTSIAEVEPIGPRKLLDVLVIAPCTGNTLAKLALGVTDSAVTMAAKAQLRNGRPVVVAVSTNDGLSVSLKNIGELLCRKNIYLVPFAQDDPVEKPNSLVADFELIPAAIEAALQGEQLQPVLQGSLE